MSETGNVVTLVSCDNENFQVDLAVAKEIGAVKNLLEDFENERTIPLTQVNKETLKKVIDFISHHHQYQFLGDNEDKKGQLTSWDNSFFEMDQQKLFELIIAANVLDVQELLDLGCKYIAEMIKGKSVEELRKTFGIVNDFTKEEEEEIKQKNKWLEEFI
ncbi:suppressor of kinetochore protein, putative [Entamoeba invadens IP1]|uniref:suppressor of kinetochore protein, putative n=1 Tax=Entamoeba invadens IP1 TaxID=370355 RepID=UPI0002C3DA77|nr:suppressor of kinetochore protein, putative [Entamoeba invadens IP1]ELP93524.1 suppressor of kinetochore protein, putative [Entamoeba invadens IP1]|eukprot:XP_004260295.1 suppressor of kinetochore protein, putative [Entamoeba invadens IP1]